jgi:two-component system response regulator AtoC
MRLLIVDDDAGLRQSLALLLQESGDEVVAEGDPEQALKRANAESFDLILCDVRMPKMDGLTFLRRYKADGGQALLIMMSAYGTEDTALAAMREGAYDYLHKPFRPDEVALTVRKAEEREHLRREVESLRSTLGTGVVHDLVVCESKAMRDLLELTGRVAKHSTTVLITGESGTGKEVLARAIHRMSPRAERSFTALNCAAIPAQLLESELFGHVRGAFTGATADRTGMFELAHQGTLLLDEIGDLPLDLQAKLLRVLEEGEIRRVGGRDSKKVDVRVLAATAKPLEQAVERGEFRSDLYYRLNVVQLQIPPLRERPEDVPALLAYFARQAAQRLGHPVSVTPAALAALSHYSWPGNVRELRNAVERAAVLGGTGPLDPGSFALGNGHRNGVDYAHASGGNGNGSNGHGAHGNGANGNGAYHGNGANGSATGTLELKAQVEAVERRAIQRALEASGGNRRQAASLLGISLRTLFYKMRRLPVE